LTQKPAKKAKPYKQSRPLLNRRLDFSGQISINIIKHHNLRIPKAAAFGRLRRGPGRESKPSPAAFAIFLPPRKMVPRGMSDKKSYI
jgi:hypothetical protein